MAGFPLLDKAVDVPPAVLQECLAKNGTPKFVKTILKKKGGVGGWEVLVCFVETDHFWAKSSYMQLHLLWSSPSCNHSRLLYSSGACARLSH